MKLKYSFLALALISMAAHAGKAERDFASQEVEPTVKKAVTAVKTSCGCDIKFDYKVEAFKDTDELRKINQLASQFTDNVGRYCNDAPSKAAICKMKTVEVSKANETTFKFSNGKGIATTEGTSVPSWDMITREVDK